MWLSSWNEWAAINFWALSSLLLYQQAKTQGWAANTKTFVSHKHFRFYVFDDKVTIDKQVAVGINTLRNVLL